MTWKPSVTFSVFKKKPTKGYECCFNCKISVSEYLGSPNYINYKPQNDIHGNSTNYNFNILLISLKQQFHGNVA